MFRPHVILHPTDLSENSRLAYSIAVDLAKQNQAQLLVLHVVETLGPENVTFGEAASQLEPASYQERLKRDLQVSLPPAAAVATACCTVAAALPCLSSEVRREGHECRSRWS